MSYLDSLVEKVALTFKLDKYRYFWGLPYEVSEKIKNILKRCNAEDFILSYDFQTLSLTDIIKGNIKKENIESLIDNFDIDVLSNTMETLGFYLKNFSIKKDSIKEKLGISITDEEGFKNLSEFLCNCPNEQVCYFLCFLEEPDSYKDSLLMQPIVRSHLENKLVKFKRVLGDCKKSE